MTIVKFPGKDIRQQRMIEEVIEKVLTDEENPDIKECIKNNVTQRILEHQLPTFDISMTISISESDLSRLQETITKEYQQKVGNYAFKLIMEICSLKARICRLEKKT